MSSCRELDNNRSALSAASAFAIATAGANEGTPTKEKYRRMSLASTGTCTPPTHSSISIQCCFVLSFSFSLPKKKMPEMFQLNWQVSSSEVRTRVCVFCRFPDGSEKRWQRVCDQTSSHQQSPECPAALGVQTLSGKTSQRGFRRDRCHHCRMRHCLLQSMDRKSRGLYTMNAKQMSIIGVRNGRMGQCLNSSPQIQSCDMGTLGGKKLFWQGVLRDCRGF